MDIIPTNDNIARGTRICNPSLGPTTSTDNDWAGLNATVSGMSCVDDDVAGLDVTAGTFTASDLGYMILEGTTQTFNIQLKSQPLANVTISPIQISTVLQLNSAAMVFTSESWNVQQLVNVTAVDNIVVGPTLKSASVNLSVISDDMTYDGLAGRSVVIYVVDDDLPEIVQTTTPVPSNVLTSSTGAKMYLLLSRIISFDVRIEISINDTTRAEVSPNVLTLSPSDFLKPYIISVTEVFNPIDAGIVPLSVNVTNIYNASVISQFVHLYAVNNITAGLNVTAAQVIVNETGT